MSRQLVSEMILFRPALEETNRAHTNHTHHTHDIIGPKSPGWGSASDLVVVVSCITRFLKAYGDINVHIDDKQ